MGSCGKVFEFSPALNVTELDVETLELFSINSL